MRALLDANILIRYLLTGEKGTVVAGIVHAGILGTYQLLLPQELLQEVTARVQGKRYLAERITEQDLRELTARLAQAATAIPPIREGPPAVTRDPKDDDRLAYAVVGRADYLVTGDRDLLVLGQAGETAIVTPTEFWRILSAGLLG